jgi:hypothetical protein
MAPKSLREKFGGLGPTLDIEKTTAGSREVVSLSLGTDLSQAKAVSAVLALRRRHVPTLEAKRAVESTIAGQPCDLDVPMVEDLDTLSADLEESGFSISVR